MAIVGFNFTKILVEKKKEMKGKVSINNSAGIKDIEKTELSLGKAKQPGLRIKFEYKSSYDPEIASILLEGEVLDLEDEKKIEEMLKEWNAKKKMPDDKVSPIINSILTRCNIEALILSKEMALPPPVPLPKVAFKK
ncbi:MAG: hypothetical protein N3D84_00240 [Candidatus Woesearchaeota archaeon]|nr:hypothetical protein [Candidatus Woesearchaeota archaeon]